MRTKSAEASDQVGNLRQVRYSFSRLRRQGFQELQARATGLWVTQTGKPFQASGEEVIPLGAGFTDPLFRQRVVAVLGVRLPTPLSAMPAWAAVCLEGTWVIARPEPVGGGVLVLASRRVLPSQLRGSMMSEVTSTLTHISQAAERARAHAARYAQTDPRLTDSD